MSDHQELIVESPQGPRHAIVRRGAGGVETRSVADVLRHENTPLNTRCGQKRICEGCIVELMEGSLLHATTGQALRATGGPLAVRGCEYRLPFDGTPVRLRIPHRSLLAYEPQVLTDYRINVPVAHDPLWRQIAIERPASADGTIDVQWLTQAIAPQLARDLPLKIADDLVDRLPTIAERHRDGGTLHATVEYVGDSWLLSEIDGESKRALGAAIDIGTTTVALMLVDLKDGKIVGRAANFNRQMHLGDDVLTRINLCSTDKSMIETLRRAVAEETILPLLDEALRQAKASHRQLACMTVAANTTMLHLYAGVDPSSMGFAPFTPTFLEHRILERRFGTGPTVHLLPGCAAYVGADLSAGILASGLLYDAGPSLLVDIGTNGEIILKHGDRVFGCATAAGPAFEGAGLECGLRAGDGAISHIRFDREPFALELEVIGHDPKHAKAHPKPLGLCGSAYVDFLAEARRIGLLTATGRIDPAEAPAGALDHVLPWEDHGKALCVARGRGGEPIVVSERDISKLMQAKGAIAAGILTLLNVAGVRAEDVKRLYLAGGFGTHMNAANAIACGLLPGFRLEQVQPVGNTSLAGAYLALLDTGVLRELARVGKDMQIVELNLHPDFETTYIDQLSLPDPA